MLILLFQLLFNICLQWLELGDKVLTISSCASQGFLRKTGKQRFLCTDNFQGVDWLPFISMGVWSGNDLPNIAEIVERGYQSVLQGMGFPHLKVVFQNDGKKWVPLCWKRDPHAPLTYTCYKRYSWCYIMRWYGC